MTHTIDREEIASKVRQILIEQLGVTENQLTREADLVMDLGAEEDDLDDIADQIGRVFNIEDFDGVLAGECVGDVIDGVVDVLATVPAEGPGR